VPANAARDAAYEALAVVLPRAALEEAWETGREEFFAETAQLCVTLEDFANVTRPLRRVDAGERRELALAFFRAVAGLPPAPAARLCKDFCGQFAPPTDEDAAQSLLAAAAPFVRALAQFDDEPGARMLVHALGATLNETQCAAPETCATRWAGWLRDIHRAGGSLSSARARLAQGAWPGNMSAVGA
jgi:hypothetical protein